MIETQPYGKREYDIGGSYVTTEWVTLFSFPLIPLRSWRMYPMGAEIAHINLDTRYIAWAQDFQVQRVKLNWKQVLNVLLVAHSIFGFLVLFPIYLMLKK